MKVSLESIVDVKEKTSKAGNAAWRWICYNTTSLALGAATFAACSIANRYLENQGMEGFPEDIQYYAGVGAFVLSKLSRKQAARKIIPNAIKLLDKNKKSIAYGSLVSGALFSIDSIANYYGIDPISKPTMIGAGGLTALMHKGYDSLTELAKEQIRGDIHDMFRIYKSRWTMFAVAGTILTQKKINARIATWVTALLLGFDQVANKIGYEGLSRPRNALLLGGAAALSSNMFGRLLRLATKRKTKVTHYVQRGNALDHMSAYRKNHIIPVIKALYKGVYLDESELFYDHEQRQSEDKDIKTKHKWLKKEFKGWMDTKKGKDVLAWLGVSDENTLDEFVHYLDYYRPNSDQVEASERGFIISAGFAIANNLSLAKEEEMCGFSLDFLESYCREGPLHLEDTVLMDLFKTNMNIAAIKADISHKLMNEPELYFKDKRITLSLLAQSLFQRFAHNSTMKREIKEIAQSINRMRLQFPEASFRGQDFIMPGVEDEGRYSKDEQMRASLLKERENILYPTFGKTKKEVKRSIHRYTRQMVVVARRIREYYDPEFTSPTRQIRSNLAKALLFEGHDRQYVTERKRRYYEAHDDLNAFMQELKGYRPEVFEGNREAKEANRALRINFYANIRKKESECGLNGMYKESGIEVCLEQIDEVIKAKAIYTDRLRAARSLHVLSMCWAVENLKIVQELYHSIGRTDMQLIKA
jgi:hypothetical protein